MSLKALDIAEVHSIKKESALLFKSELDLVNSSVITKETKKQLKKEKREKKEIKREAALAIAVANGDADTIASIEAKNEKEQGKKAKREKKEMMKERRKFLTFPEWERMVDDDRTVYYVSTLNGETAWLAPCCKCGAYSDLYCIDCGAAYCCADFEANHDNNDEDSVQSKKHKTTDHEPYSAHFSRAKLKENEEYCIEVLIIWETIRISIKDD